MTDVLEQIEAMDIESMKLKAFVDETINSLLHVYSNQRALLSLAQALWSIPDLRHLDAEHDDLIISKVSRILQRLGFKATDNELNRLGRAFLELSHSLLIVIAEQRPIRQQRTLADLKSMVFVLFQRHQTDDKLACADVEPP